MLYAKISILKVYYLFIYFFIYLFIFHSFEKKQESLYIFNWYELGRRWGGGRWDEVKALIKTI